MDNLRSEPWMQTVLNKAKDQERFHNSDIRKLGSFVRGDQADVKTLHHRGTYPSILTQKHLELKEASRNKTQIWRAENKGWEPTPD